MVDDVPCLQCATVGCRELQHGQKASKEVQIPVEHRICIKSDVAKMAQSFIDMLECLFTRALVRSTSEYPLTEVVKRDADFLDPASKQPNKESGLPDERYTVRRDRMFFLWS